MVFGYHKFDKEGHSQLFLCHYRNGEWINKQISDWSDFSWAINKTGSLGRAIGLHAIKADGSGYLYVAYSHVKYGLGLLKVNEESLELEENMAGEKLTDIAGLPEEKLPNMQINRKTDNTGKYILQWQTLPVNFDRPHEPPYPQPSELVLYETD